MITKNDILSMEFYKKKKPFTGSCQGMRYRIVLVKNEESAFFEVATWKEPYCYEKTKEEEIQKVQFPFDDAGYEQVVTYLNEQIPNYRI